MEKNTVNSPMISMIDSIPFISNVYETETGKTLKILDLIRIICSTLMIFSIGIRIIEKYREKSRIINIKTKRNFEIKEIDKIYFSRLILNTLFNPKNFVLLIGFLLNLYGYLNFCYYFIDSNEYFNKSYFIDLYQFALVQKTARNSDILSFFLYGLYSIKYLQYIQRIQILLRAYKKAAFDYVFILASIIYIFVGLSILTFFIYGSTIPSYKSFTESFIMNIKIFIFEENSSTTLILYQSKPFFSILVLIFFIFFIKHFLLNLFVPVIIENYRNEYDRYENFLINQNKKVEIYDDDEEEKPKEITLKDSKKFFFI